jgi:peroxiredoxin
MKHTLAFLAIFATVNAALAAAQISQPAPDFTGTDINGQTRKLSDFKGKVVVLESYNSDCPFCHNQYQTGAMQELQRDLTAKGVVWLLVNSVSPQNPSHRSPEAAQKEWTREKISATAWLDDSSGQIGKLYGMRTTPHMFVIDQNGVLVYEGAIDDHPSPQGDPRKARNYVRQAVNNLQSGQKVDVTQTKPYGCSVKYGS